MAKRTRIEEKKPEPVVAKPEPVKPEPKPNATDYLKGFVQWLSESPNRVFSIGGAEQLGRVPPALQRFCEANQLPLPTGLEVKKPSHFY